MSNELESKLIDLEMRLSFQEETIDQLNDAILHQNKAIEKLTKSLGLISQRIESMETESPEVGNQRPPHY